MNQLLKSAKPADMTKAEEKYWKEAEKAVEDTYDKEGAEAQKGKYYGTVTNIFKAKVEKHLGYDPFKKKKDKDKKKKKSFLIGRVERYLRKVAQAPYLIFVEEMNIPAMKLVRTDVRITETATGTVAEAKSFNNKPKTDPEVTQYIADLQSRYPGAEVKA
jgi:hypothetical protein